MCLQCVLTVGLVFLLRKPSKVPKSENSVALNVIPAGYETRYKHTSPKLVLITYAKENDPNLSSLKVKRFCFFSCVCFHASRRRLILDPNA